MSVVCEGCVLSDRGLCDELITFQGSPAECGLSEFDRDASIMRRLSPTRGYCATGGGIYTLISYNGTTGSRKFLADIHIVSYMKYIGFIN